MAYNSTEETVLSALLKNADPTDHRTFLKPSDVPNTISMNVHRILEKFEEDGLLTNTIYGTGTHLEWGYLTKEALEYHDNKEKYGVHKLNIGIEPIIYTNSIVVNTDIKECSINIFQTIKNEYDDDPELKKMMEEFVGYLSDLDSLKKLSKNKTLISKISDALKKHESLVQPFATLLAKTLASAIGINM